LSAGFREETLCRAAKDGVDFIGCDAGTTDSGPYYLGSGNPRGAREVTKHHTGLILREALKAGVPAILGSVGHAGGRPQLNWMLDIVRELARENGWHFKLAGIDSEQYKEKLAQAFRAGEIVPLEPAPHLDENAIRGAERIVAMMGVEPIQCALRQGAQVVIAGRSSDVALYAAFPLLHGIPRSVAYHAGKILECGSACVSQRFYPDSMAAVLDEEGFTIEPPNPEMRCSPQSVASHALYENGDPYQLVESGGTLDTSAAQYQAVSERAVRVSGARWLPADVYTVKLEGAALAGYRAVAFAGIRDPLLLRQLDNFLAELRRVIERKVSDSPGLKSDQYALNFRIYGRDGTLGPLEPQASEIGHEVGLLIDVVAPTQELAAAILPIVFHTGLHHPIPEHVGLISNFAFPFSPPGMNAGPVYRFCTNHVWKLADPCAPFAMTMENI
jgi:hypothetical protein